MRSRFELDGLSAQQEVVGAISAASGGVDEPASASARFIVQEPDVEEPVASSPPADRDDERQPEALESGPLQPNLISAEAEASWRDEVADRVNRYRARRRPRAPRYPSLTLKFESPEARSSSRFLASEPPPPSTHQSLAIDSLPITQALPVEHGAIPVATVHMPAETGKVLEFPRSLTLPSRPLDELADPVLDCPRILEVPEVTPPPPALGGILIESGPDRVEEKRPGFEIPLQPARLSRRMGAAAIDGLFVLAACAMFAYIFFRVTATVPPLPLTIESSVILAAILWAGYQYLAVVLAGTTPGLRLAKLHLHRFDGSAVPKRVRQWRMLASLLSGISLGLGYAWCFLDEDQLCWHDRITRTYMAPK